MTDGTPSPEPPRGEPCSAARMPPRPTPCAVMAEATAAERSRAAGRSGRVSTVPFTVGLLLTLGGLAALLLGIALTNISTVIIYIALAMFAALGLDPVIKWFEQAQRQAPVGDRDRLPRRSASSVPACCALVVPTLIDQVAAFIKGIPATITNFENSDFYAWLEGIFGAGPDRPSSTTSRSSSPDPRTSRRSRAACSRSAPGSPRPSRALLIIVVLTLYFVASLPGIKESLMQFAPARNRPKVRAMTNQITDSVGGYLMGMVILAFFNSVVATLLHLVLGLPYPLLMGVLAFSITIIPLVGPVLYWIFATVLALFTQPALGTDLRHRYLIYIQIEAYVITPRVMSKAISIPGSLVVIGALIGGTLLGLIGALVAIPVTASILLIIKQVFIPRQDAKI